MPQAALIDGRAIAGRMREQLTAVATVLRERHRVTAGLAAILVGDDPASAIYVRNKANACASVGITSSLHRLPADTAEATLIALVERLGHDDAIDGILVQLPLPAGIDARRVIAAIAPEKDIDGFHPVNVGGLWSGRPGLVPCTPQGCLILVRSVRANPAGAEVVVLGRSAIVGKPVAALLLAADCTVTLAHSYSRDLAAICRRADILIAAAGRPQIVKADWIKPGATVIDVGISRVGNPDGGTRLVGDVDFAAAREVAGAITPVPGGVGPMTIACLLRNTVLAACRRRGLPESALPTG